MTSTKPYVRKRAVLLLYKVFLNNPDALKPAFPRLKEKLEDPDPGFLTKIFFVKFNFSLFLFRCTSSSC
jgi:vesicle coat complex subunit